jgi:HPt (histidine-containing phosphotransfer) domain-containing protein
VPFDPEHVAALGADGSPESRARLREFMAVFFTTLDETAAAMRTATDTDTLRRHAHRAKGASGLAGARALAAFFADLEVRAAAGEFFTPQVYDHLHSLMADLRNAVQAQTED